MLTSEHYHPLLKLSPILTGPGAYSVCSCRSVLSSIYLHVDQPCRALHLRIGHGLHKIIKQIDWTQVKKVSFQSDHMTFLAQVIEVRSCVWMKIARRHTKQPIISLPPGRAHDPWFLDYFYKYVLQVILEKHVTQFTCWCGIYLAQRYEMYYFYLYKIKGPAYEI